jgi:Tol biopolymer transport system component
MPTVIIKKSWTARIFTVNAMHVLLIVSCCRFLSGNAHGAQTPSTEVRHTSFLLSPDGLHLCYGVPAYNRKAERTTRLMVCKSDGTEPREAAVVPADHDKFLSADLDEILWWGNDRIICSYRESLRYIVVSLDGVPLSDIRLPDGCDILYKRISPKCRRVAFVGSFHSPGGSRQNGLFVVELETGRVRHLIDKPLKSAPAWSADSQKLAIGNSPGYAKYYPLVIVNVQTGEVTSMEVEGVGASWSPDGRYLAFTTEIVRGGSWLYGIPKDGRIGVLNLVTGELNHAGPAALNNRERETGKYETQGSLLPVWSPDGQQIAYLRSTASRENKESRGKKSEEIWIVDKQGQNPRKIVDGFYPIAWAGDNESLFVLKDNKIDRIDTRSLSLETVVSWQKAQRAELPPADAIVFNKPGVIVKTVRIDRAYGEAFAAILSEARREYENIFGFSLPETIILEARWEPRQNLRLWTDGNSRIFLTISSQRQLAPSPRSGIFNIYGLCHELGHIVMYRGMKNQVGLPDGVGEGWAHYAGSVVVDAVAERLGPKIWPERYDVRSAEGLLRLQNQVGRAGWRSLDATTRAAKVFYEIEKKHGRKMLGAALNRALSQRPSGKELMPLIVQSLRELTAEKTAGDWIPKEVLVPETKWNVKERQAGGDFFGDIKVLTDQTGILLYYDDGTPEGKLSIAGSGHALLFQRPEETRFIDRVDVFGSRYGTRKPPEEDFTVYVCDEDFNPLHEFNRPYGLFQRGENQWFKIPVDSVSVPRRFYVCLSFNPTSTKGVYVAYDQSVTRSHSRTGLPYTHINDVKKKYDWMIRVHLCKDSEQ